MGENIERYRTHLHRRHLAQSTVSRYVTDLRAFARHLGPEQSITNATTEQVEAFLDTRKLDARSRYRWLSELHRFYAWGQAHGLTDTDPTLIIDRPRLSRLLPRPVDDDVLRHAISVAGPQMRAWLVLASYAGLRCAEIARLDRASVGPKAIRVVGKGGHERVVPLHPMAADTLARSPLARTGPVFRRECGQPFTPKDVSRRAALYFEAIGYPGVTLHQLRHSFGTRVYRYSLNLRATQELMGHADPATTAGYAAVGADDLAVAVAALPDL